MYASSLSLKFFLIIYLLNLICLSVEPLVRRWPQPQPQHKFPNKRTSESFEELPLFWGLFVYFFFYPINFGLVFGLQKKCLVSTTPVLRFFKSIFLFFENVLKNSPMHATYSRIFPHNTWVLYCIDVYHLWVYYCTVVYFL